VRRRDKPVYARTTAAGADAHAGCAPPLKLIEKVADRFHGGQ
jgi:hypothetical protein